MAETLQDLLKRAKEKQGVTSGRALADLTSKHEHKIDRTQVNGILKGTYKSRPSHGLIKAVAWLAKVDEAVAYAAAGVPMPGPPFAKELPPDSDYLSPQQRHAVITVIRTFLGSAEEEGAARGNAAAITEASPGLSLVPPADVDESVDDEEPDEAVALDDPNSPAGEPEEE